MECVDPTTNVIVTVDFPSSHFDGSGYIWEDVNARESINRTENRETTTNSRLAFDVVPASIKHSILFRLLLPTL